MRTTVFCKRLPVQDLRRPIVIFKVTKTKSPKEECIIIIVVILTLNFFGAVLKKRVDQQIAISLVSLRDFFKVLLPVIHYC